MDSAQSDFFYRQMDRSLNIGLNILEKKRLSIQEEEEETLAVSQTYSFLPNLT
jgi:hypothetical protein